MTLTIFFIRPDSNHIALKTIILLTLMLSILTKSVSAVDLEQADKLIHQWLEIERQTSRLETDWQLQKPHLTQRISLLQAEKKQLRTILNKSDEGQSEAEQQRATLLAEQTEMEIQQTELKQQLKNLSSQLQAVSVLLSPPLQAPWQDEQSLLGTTPETTVELQVALAQLSKLADFNQRISVHEMLIQTPGGDEILVKQLYLGASVAWFTNKDGSYTGTGRATSEGWQWKFDKVSHNKEIAKAIAIFEKQKEADFVRLPIHLYSAEINK